MNKLAAACEALLDYRNRNSGNFQIEKADDFFRRIRIELDLLSTAPEATEIALKAAIRWLVEQDWPDDYGAWPEEHKAAIMSSLAQSNEGEKR